MYNYIKNRFYSLTINQTRYEPPFEHLEKKEEEPSIKWETITQIITVLLQYAREQLPHWIDQTKFSAKTAIPKTDATANPNLLLDILKRHMQAIFYPYGYSHQGKTNGCMLIRHVPLWIDVKKLPDAFHRPDGISFQRVFTFYRHGTTVTRQANASKW